MVRKGFKVSYTDEDLKGFTFSTDEKCIENIYLLKDTWLYLINFILFILVNIFSNSLFVSISALLVVSIELFVLIRYDYVLRRSKKHPIKYIEVMILAKYDIEYEDDDKSGRMLYPVLGRDTTNGYESKCYISREQYDCNTCGSTIKIYKRLWGVIVLRVTSISHIAFNRESMSFVTVEDNVLISYSSDRYGDSDYKITFEDTDTHEVYTFTGSKAIYDFVDVNHDNIFSCIDLDSRYKSYLIVKWTDFDLSLLDLIEFEGYLNDVEVLSDKSLIGVVSKSYGTIFQLILEALRLCPIDNTDYYKYKGSLTELGQFSIKDGKLYVTELENKVVVYRIKNVKRFFGIFTKKIVLER